MIWQEHTSESACGVSLHKHVFNEVRSHCRSSVDARFINEIARAVERYLDLLPDSSAVPDDYLALIIARALRGAGEEDAARNVLASVASKGFDSCLLGELAEANDLTPARWRLFSARLVRPSRWSSEGGQMIWILDLRRLRIGSDHCFELSLLPVLRRVLRNLCEVWDSKKGAVVLGLSGMDAVSRQLSTTQRGAARIAGQIEAFCREALDGSAAERGWEVHPRVLVLDAGRRS